ncbi:MAG: hypothetical protein KUF77_18615 [Candidatus Thiodiazotropha sp. (ex Lucina aurantia)]|nr:hypothetical protein [Candidatus Thiodiazotropha sp. (ex Lucina pensylvanica)]MBT3025238.1 hypothetical protein [Candidatus Thiodiazotropha taylori]MBV2098381.1 hypothetical protein [Candidatus Thiodiazotropha sp. (ex Codakia orbicularis)]MBV2105047.1 hypothetical protein [Candidatus Thiodiazotropha sp. (ex Lucina aurantia)]MBV2118893.1 hypothetical protein [Candidatus Thiodiazotropha sp. (ex Lucina aurantia)]
MAIRLHSSVKSLRNGDITILAIIETLLAVSVSLFVAVTYETLIHIAIGACIAPFLLLRTTKSTEQGLKLFEEFLQATWMPDKYGILTVWIPQYQIYNNNADVPDDFGPAIMFRVQNRNIFLRIYFGFASLFLSISISILTIISAIAFKIYVTTINFLRHPKYTIRQIPNNWSRAALMLDTAYPPELLPGLEERTLHYKNSDRAPPFYFYAFNSSLYVKTVSRLFGKRLKEKPQNITAFPFYSVALLLLLLIPTATLMVSVIYRWSLKSTSLIYGFLAWTLNSTLWIRQNLRQNLLITAQSAIGKFVLYYSFLVAIISFCKFYIFFWNQSLLTALSQTPGWKVLAVYLAPRQLENVGMVIDFWHVTAFINSVLAIFMFFYADLMLLRMKENQPWPEKTTIAIAGGNHVLRSLLTIYTIGCVLYVTIMAIPQDAWQRYSIMFLPW